MRMRLFPHSVLAGATIAGLLAFTGSDDQRFAKYVVDPRTAPITLHWKAPDGAIYGNIGTLERACAAKGSTLRFAMNGGMYDPQRKPVGLYIEDGVQHVKLNTSKEGTDNFTMQPNGVFGVTSNGTAFVCRTADFIKQQHVAYATQSGPMLVADGVMNAHFKAGSANLHIRNGVGLRPDGQVVFAISREPVNFHDFASWFIAQGCTNALYLDGSVSRAFIPNEGLVQQGGDLGVLIAVIERP